MLIVIDEFTRRCPAIVVARRLRSDDVLHCLTELFVAYGTPHSSLGYRPPEPETMRLVCPTLRSSQIRR